MQVWPNFISATERNKKMCLSLQGMIASIGSLSDEGLPQLGVFAKGRRHKKECITANSQFSSLLPRVSESSMLGENPSDRQVYHGNSCIQEGHKN